MSPLFLILTSASVGVLASSLISMIGQAFERRSRRKELFISKAIELAIAKTELAKNIAIATRQRGLLVDPILLAANNFKDLNSIFKFGVVTQETMKMNEESERRIIDELEEEMKKAK